MLPGGGVRRQWKSRPDREVTLGVRGRRRWMTRPDRGVRPGGICRPGRAGRMGRGRAGGGRGGAGGRGGGGGGGGGRGGGWGGGGGRAGEGAGAVGRGGTSWRAARCGPCWCRSWGRRRGCCCLGGRGGGRRGVRIGGPRGSRWFRRLVPLSLPGGWVVGRGSGISRVGRGRRRWSRPTARSSPGVCRSRSTCRPTT